MYILNRWKDGGVVGGWTETKRMKTQETRLYMPTKRETRKGLLPNKNLILKTIWKL